MSIRSIVVMGSLVGCALQALVPHVAAQSAKQRVRVTSAMVVSALAAKQLPAEGVNVRISAPITSASEQPMLQVDTVMAMSQHTAQLRMLCANRSDCIPFFVEVTWPDAVNVAALGTQVNHNQHETAKSVPAPKSAPEPSSFAISSGKQAVLLIEDAHVHVFIHVVALENGLTGDTIQVATPDHKQRFVAAVIDSELLKGHF